MAHVRIMSVRQDGLVPLGAIIEVDGKLALAEGTAPGFADLFHPLHVPPWLRDQYEAAVYYPDSPRMWMAALEGIYSSTYIQFQFIDDEMRQPVEYTRASERTSAPNVHRALELLRRLGPVPERERLASALSSLLDRYPDLRKKMPGSDLSWLKLLASVD